MLLKVYIKATGIIQKQKCIDDALAGRRMLSSKTGGRCQFGGHDRTIAMEMLKRISW